MLTHLSIDIVFREKSFRWSFRPLLATKCPKIFVYYSFISGFISSPSVFHAHLWLYVARIEKLYRSHFPIRFSMTCTYTHILCLFGRVSPFRSNSIRLDRYMHGTENQCVQQHFVQMLLSTIYFFPLSLCVCVRAYWYVVYRSREINLA